MKKEQTLNNAETQALNIPVVICRYLSKTDKVGFGKHKDKTLEWVGINEPSYLNWMFNKVNGVSDSIRNMKEDRLYMLKFIYNHRQSQSDKFEVWAHIG